MPLRKSKSFSSKHHATSSAPTSLPSFDLPSQIQNDSPPKPPSRPLHALRSLLGLKRTKSTYNLNSDSNTDLDTKSIPGSTSSTPPNILSWRKKTSAYASPMHESPRSYRSVDLPDVPPIINIGFGSGTPSGNEHVSTSSSTPSSRSNTTTTEPTSVDADANVPFSGSSDTERDTGFRILWKKVKPADKPDEGVPFDNDDAMFYPPAVSGNGRGSYYESTPPSAAIQYDSTNVTPGPEPRKERSERDREGRHKDREHREHRDRDKDRDREHRHKDREHKEKKSTRNRIIPLEEDIRRLFQECKIGLGNASLLSQALVHAKVEELKKGERGEVIKEFRLKCLSSQELIAAQIPWATAGAERSRKEKEREKALLYGEDNESSRRSRDRNRDRSFSQLADAAGIPGTDSPIDEQTTEEKLLGALLEANGELLAALGQYDDLERVAIERKTEEKSRKEIRMDRRAIATLEQQQQFEDIAAVSGAGAGGSTVHLTNSRSPSPVSHRGSRPSSMVMQHPLPQHPHSLLTHPAQQQHLAVQSSLSNHSPEIPGTTLAPPRAPPHGPRSPASGHGHGHGHTRTGSSGFPPSRTPSPNTPSMDYSSSGTGTGESVSGSAPEVARRRDLVDGFSSLNIDKGRAALAGRSSMDQSSDEEILTPIKPSAKALGKRRVDVNDDTENSFNPDDLYYDQTRELGSVDSYNPYLEGDLPIPPGNEGGVFNYNSDSDDSESAYYPNGRPRSRNNGLLHHLHHPPVHFVYDAAAERTQQRIREMENQMERSVEVGNVH